VLKDLVAQWLDSDYDHTCYAPLLIFCGRHLLMAKLRALNGHPTAGTLEELNRIIAPIKAQ